MSLILRFTLFTHIFLILCTSVSHAETHYLVKVTDMLQNVEYQAMSRSDYYALDKTIKTENRYFSKAHSMAQKKWEASEGSRYPGNGLHKRTVTKYTSYMSLEAAQAAVLNKTLAMEREEERRIDREKRNQNNYSRNSRGGSSRNSRGGNSRNSSYMRNKQRKEESDAEREESLTSAHSYFIQELDSLMNDTSSTSPFSKENDDANKH